MAIFVPRFVRQLRDVLLTAPADGEVLTYDSADEKWKNEAGGGGGGDLTDAVILAPASSARNVIQPTAGDVIAAIVKAHAAQSVDLTQWQLSDGTPTIKVGFDGKVLMEFDGQTIDPSLAGIDKFQILGDAGGGALIRMMDIANEAVPFTAVMEIGSSQGGTNSPSRFTNDGSMYFSTTLDVPLIEMDTAETGWLQPLGTAPLLQFGSRFQVGPTGTILSNPSDAALAVLTLRTAQVYVGTGSPEGVVTAPVGSAFLRTDGAGGTTFYVKESGAGDTGWTAISAGSGAPTTATYITQTPDAGLSAEQALSALATGLVKNTTGTGVLSIGAAGTDYAAASHAHEGEDITSGTVEDARIASTIARDSEVAAGYQPLDADLTVIAALADPNADRILFWDDSLGAYTFLTPGTGLTITGTTIDAAGGSGGYPRTFKTGLYYLAPSSSTNTDSGVAQVLDRVLYVPFAVGEAVTADRIGASVTAFAATSVVRLGIYSSTDGQPDARVLDAGTIDAATNGFKEITISQALSANSLYWIAVVPQTAGCTLRASAVGAGAEWVGTTLLTADIRTANFQEAGVSGALPANATPVTGITQSPMARLRAA